MLDRGRQESKNLQTRFKEQDEEMARQQAAPEEEPRAAESIDEGFHFLDNLWRGGADPDRKTTSAAGGRAAGEIDLEALRSDSPFRGFLGTKAAGVESDFESSQARTVEVRSLSPLPETAAIPAQPALETPPAPTEAPRLSFQRMGGGARIVLSLTSETTWSRVLATLLLLGALAIHAVILVRRG